MNREMKKALQSRSRYDWAVHEETRRRNAEQIQNLPEPEFPATGTARIGALVAEARRRRDEAYRAACTEGGAGFRTGRPGDASIESRQLSLDVSVSDDESLAPLNGDAGRLRSHT